MNKGITRRNLFKFAGGSLAGLILSPVPWKLVDDVAIWTQNWSWIPKPPRGPVKFKFTNCSICPAGCALRARCVGDQPVGLMGVAGHPSSFGSICPVGLSAHHLPYHPARLTHPVRQTLNDGKVIRSQTSFEEAISEIGRVITELQSDGDSGSVAVLDQRPGRVTSLIYRQFLAGLKRSVYVVPTQDVPGFTDTGRLTEMPIGPLGLDLERSRTILSFGAPLFEGWGNPGRMMRLLRDRRSGDADRLCVIQVETRHSTTANLADVWLPLNPGTEAALALGIAHVIVNDKLIDAEAIRRSTLDFENEQGPAYRELIGRFNPEKVAEVTGIAPDKIRETARALVSGAPSAVIVGEDPAGGPLGRGEEMAIWGLNVLLGAIGRTGGYLPRRPVPEPELAGARTPLEASCLARVPDQSVRVLILDGAESGLSIPWGVLEKKLVPKGALIVSLSPYAAGLATHADWIIPAPTFMETFEEILPAPEAVACSYSLAVPLIPQPDGAPNTVSIIQRLAVAAGTPLEGEAGSLKLEELLKRRVDAIHKFGRGKLFRYPKGETLDMTAVDSPDAFWKALSEGAWWFDESPEDRQTGRFMFLGERGEGHRQLAALENGRLHSASVSTYPLILMPYGWKSMTDTGQLSPVLTKIFSESDLRTSWGIVAVNPLTARAHGLADRGRAVIESSSGSAPVLIHFDETVMPGVIEGAVGPDPVGLDLPPRSIEMNILSLCAPDDDGVRRVKRVKVREA